MVVPIDITFNLCAPELAVCLGEFAAITGVTVPETTVHEQRYTVLRQHEIRCSGKVSPVQPEAVSKSMEERPNEQFLPRILVSDTRHNLATFLFREEVHTLRIWQRTTLHEQPWRLPRRATEVRRYQFVLRFRS